MTLVEFLLARIAEDEAAQQVMGWAGNWHTFDCDLTDNDYYGGCNCGLPARALAECEAKRTTIAVCTSAGPYISENYRMDPDATDVILRALALPYADHPKFREEWRPC